jgi:hypothetical protein
MLSTASANILPDRLVIDAGHRAFLRHRKDGE